MKERRFCRMALSAGRVGVAKDQVDEFGNIIGGETPENVYTKTQCDNKFETKTHAGNTYQTKTIEVPLELLGGSQLTVETSLHALEDTLGTLRFRNNDGTPQVKTPSGDWVNFNSGGGLPSINLAELSPSTTGRSELVVTARPDIIDEIVLYSDANRTVEIGRCSFESACVVLNVPELVDVYWKVFKNGTAVGTSNANSGNLKAYNDSTNHKFVANNNTVDNGHFGVILIG